MEGSLGPRGPIRTCIVDPLITSVLSCWNVPYQYCSVVDVQDIRQEAVLRLLRKRLVLQKLSKKCLRAYGHRTARRVLMNLSRRYNTERRILREVSRSSIEVEHCDPISTEIHSKYVVPCGAFRNSQSAQVGSAKVLTVRALILLAIICCVLKLGGDAFSTCTGCGVGESVSLGWVGLIFYLSLLVYSARSASDRVFAVGVSLAAVFHLWLAMYMILTGMLCELCLILAVNAVVLVSYVLLLNRYRLVTMFTLPAMAGVLTLGIVGMEWRRVDKGSISASLTSQRIRGKIIVSIFERKGCPLCVELRNHVIPFIASEYGDRLKVEYHNADNLKFIRWAPTVVVRSHEGSLDKIFEGKPRLEQLRSAIDYALGQK